MMRGLAPHEAYHSERSPSPQRFGDSLNPHFDLHLLALDGVLSSDGDHGG